MDLDVSAGIQIGGVAVPALTVRRTDTSIELGDGETFVISGLVSTRLNDSVNKMPWLGDIPVLGAFFKSTPLDRSDTELKSDTRRVGKEGVRTCRSRWSPYQQQKNKKA